MQINLFDTLPDYARAAVIWARPAIGGQQNVVGLATPVNPEALAWWAERTLEAKTLKSGTLALRTTAAIAGLPNARGGSRHEGNALPW